MQPVYEDNLHDLTQEVPVASGFIAYDCKAKIIGGIRHPPLTEDPLFDALDARI